MEKWICEEAEKPKPQRKVEKPEEDVHFEEKKPGWKGKQPLKEPKTDIDMRTADIKDPQAAAYWKKVRMMNDESMVKRVDLTCPGGDDVRVFTQIPDPGAEHYPPSCVQKGYARYHATHKRSELKHHAKATSKRTSLFHIRLRWLQC